MSSGSADHETGEGQGRVRVRQAGPGPGEGRRPAQQGTGRTGEVSRGGRQASGQSSFNVNEFLLIRCSNPVLAAAV